MAANIINKITIISQNCHGLNQGQQLLDDLCRAGTAQVLFIQEHWQTPANMAKILNFNNKYTGFGISGMEAVMGRSVLRGRSFGGVATLIRNDYLPQTNCLVCAERYNIIAIGQTIFINVYLPCYSTDSVNIISTLLSEIYDTVSLYPNYDIVLGGDLNTDLKDNSRTTNAIRNFMADLKLTLVTDVIRPNSDHTYFHETQQHHSFVDYFMFSTHLMNNAVEFRIMNDVVTLSDHWPLYLAIPLPLIVPIHTPAAKSDHIKSKQLPRLRWDHCSLQGYYSVCYARLQPILEEIDSIYVQYLDPLLTESDSYLCSSDLVDIRPTVISFIEEVYLKLTSILVKTADELIPKMGPTTLKNWWNDELNGLKQAAIESNNQWIADGRPKHGLLAEVRKNDKYAYKLAIRKYKKIENDGISLSLLNTFSDKTSSNFWKTWKSKMGSKNPPPKIVNGKTDEQEIADCFANHFAAACSSNSKVRSEQLFNEYCARKKDYCYDNNMLEYLLSVELVDRCIHKLKPGKSAALDQLTTEHLVNCHPIIALILTKLFNLMIMSEYVPNSFARSILVPILKVDIGTKNVSVDDYRGISINPVISKVFEHCLLELFAKFLETSDKQFGYKSKSGCRNALYSVRKTVEFFINRNTTVNLCALDLSKAFDKLNRYALFQKLMDRKCPIVFINILDCWYEKNYASVKWGACYSPFVKLLTGTRQGGITSPYLFAVYIDDVITKLQKSALGCHIYNVCFNAFVYADDILLASISIMDLQRMIDICKDELDWLDMSMNIKKSMCMRIGKRFNATTSDVSLNGNAIKWCSEIKYLGMYIPAATNFKCNLHYSKMKFFRSLNSLFGKLGSSPHIGITLFLVSTNCNPILFYGLEAMRLSKANYSSLCYPYNSAYMKLFSTFDKNTITLCQFYSGELPLSYAVDVQTLNFYTTLRELNCNPSNILFKWFGNEELIALESKYGIEGKHVFRDYNKLIRKSFDDHCATLNVS